MNAVQVTVDCVFVGEDNDKRQSPFVFSTDVTGFVNVFDELMLRIRNTQVLYIYLHKYNTHAALSEKLCVCIFMHAVACV